MAGTPELRFAPPGPGLWHLDGMHIPRPVTPIGAATFGPPIERGARQGFARYGLFQEGFAVAFVERFMYGGDVPLATRPPGEENAARAEFDQIVGMNPLIQARFRTAAAALQDRLWEQDLTYWDTVARPRLQSKTLALTDTDPAGLSDDGLLAHLAAVCFHLCTTWEWHHLLNPLALPLGFFLEHAMAWTGATVEELAPLLQGAAPISAGDEPELRTLVHALQSEGAEGIVDAGVDPADQIERLRSFDGGVGPAATAYLRAVGYRTIGSWDAMDRYALEEPAALVALIRRALTGAWPQPPDGALEAVRDRVHDAQRQEFDRLLADARRFARIRDERDLYCNLPVGGLVRRATVEIGRRLVAAGRLPDVELATEASYAELDGLLHGGGPSEADLQARHDVRLSQTANDAPPILGAAVEEEVPLAWLPDGCRQLEGAMLAAWGPEHAPETTPTAAPGRVLGVGASAGTYEGPARLVLGPDDFDKILQGDVLVALTTNPAFNVLLPYIGALVTDHGGTLSHAAVIAREHGLPAVVGCGNATGALADGVRVRVDGRAGEVTILD